MVEMTTNMEGDDIEVSVTQTLDNQVMGDGGLPWPFTMKVYSILFLQLLVNLLVCSIIVTVHRVADLLPSMTPGSAICIVSLVTRFFILFPVKFCRGKHVFNFLLLSLFTVSMSFTVGLTCAIISGRVVLEAASITVLLAVSFTLYVFWAASWGSDTQFQGSFLFFSLMSLICFGILTIFFPYGKISPIIFSILRTVIFSGYIMHDTNNLLKTHGRDDDSWVSISVLYMDIINLFLHLLELLGSGGK